METEKQSNLGTAAIIPLVFRFAVPTIIAMLVGAIYNLADQFFIGQTVGPLGNAATNVAFPMVTCCTALALLFGVGGASAFNLAMGRGEKSAISGYVGNSLTLLVVSGVILLIVTELFAKGLVTIFGGSAEIAGYAEIYIRVTAVGYPALLLTSGGGHLMRADGSPRMTMITSASGAILNIVLDLVFVFGLEMGMLGAALATVIGQMLSAGMVCWYFARRFQSAPLDAAAFRVSRKKLTEIAAIGVSPCFHQLTNLLLEIVMNNSLRYYGGLSIYGEAIPLACSGIVMKVNEIYFSVVIGIGQGCQPIFSYNYGAKAYGRVRKTFLTAVEIGFAVGVVCMLLFQCKPRWIMGLFGEGTEEYFAFGVKFFRIFLIGTPVAFFQSISSSFFSAIGKAHKGFALSFVRQLVLQIPLALLLPRVYGIDGLLYSGGLTDCLIFVAAVGMIIFEFVEIRREERSVSP